MKISKCIITLVVVVAMVFCFSAVSFASTNVSLASDTTVTLIDDFSLPVPQAAICGPLVGGVGSSTYIIYKVKYGLYCLFVIDTFSHPAGVVESATLTWRQFKSDSIGLLETPTSLTWSYTDFTDLCYDPVTTLLTDYDNSSVTAVYSTFDFRDSDGNLIIADCDGSFGSDDDSSENGSGADGDSGSSEAEIGLLQDILNEIKNGFANLIEVVSDGFATVKETIRNGFGSIASYFESLIAFLKDKEDSTDIGIIIENNTIIDDEDKEPFDPDVYKGIVKVLRNTFNFFSGFFGFVYDGINNFIGFVSDPSSEFYGLFHLNSLG